MIVIERLKAIPVREHRIEIVERKGKGHPDYICDSIMDAISVSLCDVYMKEFGAILHHNIDKGLLAAGRTIKAFGRGQVLEPMELIIGDRATFNVGDKRIAVEDIAIQTARKWFKENLRHVDPERHVKYRSMLAEGSAELADIFLRAGKCLGANDTSAATGYYPLSPTETVVLEFEKHLNSTALKARFPESGEDVKVMGLRQGRMLDITVAMPLLCADIASEEEYFSRKELILDEMIQYLARFKGSNFQDILVHYNALDEKGRGLGGVYLSVLGTSAEDADSGQVGRGNRVNGLISLNRPMGTEAAAGKNPVSHVGKIYNILAHRIAKEIYTEADGIEEVYVLLLSRIGAPIDRPQMASAQVLLEPGKALKKVVSAATEVFEKEFRNISQLCLELAQGRHSVC